MRRIVWRESGTGCEKVFGAEMLKDGMDGRWISSVFMVVRSTEVWKHSCTAWSLWSVAEGKEKHLTFCHELHSVPTDLIDSNGRKQNRTIQNSISPRILISLWHESAVCASMISSLTVFWGYFYIEGNQAQDALSESGRAVVLIIADFGRDL